MYPKLTIEKVIGHNGKECAFPVKSSNGIFYGCWGKNYNEGQTYCYAGGRETLCHDSSK